MINLFCVGTPCVSAMGRATGGILPIICSDKNRLITYSNQQKRETIKTGQSKAQCIELRFLPVQPLREIHRSRSKDLKHPDKRSKGGPSVHPCTIQKSRESRERSREMYWEVVVPVARQSLCRRSSSHPPGSPQAFGLGTTPLMRLQSRLYQV